MPALDTSYSGRANRVGLWLCAAALLTLAGCSAEPPLALLPDQSRRLAPLLLSELRPPADPAEVIDSRFTLVAPGADPVRLRLEGTGCTCYGVQFEGRRLKIGETITIEPGEPAVVRIEVPFPERPGEPQFYARFIQAGDLQPTPLVLSLTVPTYADVRLVPEVLTIGYRPGEPPPPAPLRVTRTARDTATLQTPPFVGPPPEPLRLSDWREIETEQPGEGLWRRTWEADVSVELPQDERDVLQRALQVHPGGADSETAVSQVQVLIQPRVGVRAPRTIALGTLRLHEPPRQRRILLAAVDRVPFRITGITSDDDRCSAVVDSPEAAATQWLTLEVTPDRAGDVDATLTCTTDHPESAVLTLKAEGRIRPAEGSPDPADGDPAD